MIPVTIIRHPKERLDKCSLKHLQNRKEIHFFTAVKNFRFDATGYLLLKLDAPPLSPSDTGCPILILDSTWRLLLRLEACLEGKPLARSIPLGLKTAYPRVSKIFKDPPNGLASIEALYLTKYILGENDPSLLEGYHWKEGFLKEMHEWLNRNYCVAYRK